MHTNLVLSAFVLIVAASTAIAQTGGVWTDMGPMRYTDPVTGTTSDLGKQSAIAAESGGNLYVYGGMSFIGTATGNQRHLLVRYAPTTNTWTTLSPIPPSPGFVWDAWQYACGVGLNGSLYQFGGLHRRNNGTSTTVVTYYSDDVWRYDVAAATWNAAAPLVTGLLHARAAVLGGKIYLVGGEHELDKNVSVYEYTPGANTWILKGGELPEGVTYHHLASIGGKLYVVGGEYWSDYCSKFTREYDPVTETWTDLADMPDEIVGGGGRGRLNGGCATAGDRMYILGGQCDYGSGGSFIYQTRSVMEFTPASGEWRERAPLPSGFFYNNAAATTVLNAVETIYSFGGGSSAALRAATLQFAPPMTPQISNLYMETPSGTPLAEGAWTSTTAIFVGATVAAQGSVTLEVEISDATPFFPLQNVKSIAGAAGVHKVLLPGLTQGNYTIRARSVDALNEYSAWAYLGDPAVVDLHIDLVSPTTPIAVTPPADSHTAVDDVDGGPVTFAWTAATDNHQLAGYELWVAYDANFGNMIATASPLQTAATLTLPLSKTPFYWMVRAVDVAGNVGPWSNAIPFNVYFDDGLDHGKGDAKVWCGFSAPAAPTWVAWALLALLATSVSRRR